MSDLELIEQFRNGKEEVFEELVRRYQKKVYNTTYRMLGNHEDASDLAQEAFLRVYRNLRKFKGTASFSTWLFTITSNICRDELRKRGRRLQTQSLSDPIQMNDGEIERDIPDEGMLTPEEQSVNREFRDQIQGLLEELPAEQKEVIVLREFQGFSYEEIAQITEVAVGTVKSRISRARRNMREELNKLVVSSQI